MDLVKAFGENPGAMFGAMQSSSDPEVNTFYKDKMAKGKIGIRGVDAKAKITPPHAVFAALHETGHAMERAYLPGTESNVRAKGSPYYLNFNNQKRVYPGNVFSDTFRGVIAAMMRFAGGEDPGDTGGYTKQDAADILTEITNMQKKGVLSDATGSQIPVRDLYPQAEDYIRQNPGREAFVDFTLNQRENEYLQTPQELAADAIGIYLFDPALAKRMMPKTAKLIRKVMNDGDVATFYSMPLAALVAAIMANMFVSDREEDEMRGVLSFGQGALSA